MSGSQNTSATDLERPLLRAGLALVALGVVAVVVAVIAVRRGDADDVEPQAAAGDATVFAGRSPELGALDGGGPVIGQPAPDFALLGADGAVVRLSDLRGKVVFINFWATWCVPCRRELPDIQAIYDEKRSEGLEVLAVNYRDDLDAAKAFFAERALAMPMLLDFDGEVYDQYRLQGLPDSFFVDRDGNIAAVQFGFLTQEKMRERLAAAGLP